MGQVGYPYDDRKERPVTAEPLIPLETKHTERSMLDMLRRHYIADDRHPAWVFAPGIQAPGRTLRKADLICLGAVNATGSLLVGHEIKVSRADVMVELADLTKCDPWMRYCDEWYLVVPDAAILDGLAIPESWGILTPPSGRRTRSMTVTRKAPRLRPLEQAPALRTIAAWQHWRLRDQAEKLADSADRLAEAIEANRELRSHRPSSDPRRAVVAKILSSLGGSPSQGQIGEWDREVSVDDVVVALKNLGAVYHRRDEAECTIERLRSSLENARDSAQFALSEMDAHKGKAKS